MVDLDHALGPLLSSCHCLETFAQPVLSCPNELVDPNRVGTFSLDRKNSPPAADQTVRDLPTCVGTFTTPRWVPQKAHNVRSNRLCKALVSSPPHAGREPRLFCKHGGDPHFVIPQLSVNKTKKKRKAYFTHRRTCCPNRNVFERFIEPIIVNTSWRIPPQARPEQALDVSRIGSEVREKTIGQQPVEET